MPPLAGPPPPSSPALFRDLYTSYRRAPSGDANYGIGLPKRPYLVDQVLPERQAYPKAAPANVSDEELKSFLGLVNKHGASVVGALLAAYGTCKEKWEGDDQDALV